MSEKRWSDQPDEVEHAAVLGTFHVNHREHAVLIELRVAPNAHEPKAWYLSAGTLFGSQTVKCETSAVVLNVLCNMGKTMKLPKGAELMENEK